jgi:hypothetical protein
MPNEAAVGVAGTRAGYHRWLFVFAAVWNTPLRAPCYFYPWVLYHASEQCRERLRPHGAGLARPSWALRSQVKQSLVRGMVDMPERLDAPVCDR